MVDPDKERFGVGRACLLPLTLCLTLCLTLASSVAQGDVMFRDSFEFRVAALEYLVVWEDDPDGNGFNDLRGLGQRLNADARGEQRSPAVAVADDGGFVVTWADGPSVDGEFSVLMRGFNADGSERFATQTVSGVEVGPRPSPDIAMAPDGDFVVVFADDRDGNGFGQIRAHGFAANGMARFVRSAVNNLGAGDQIEPVVAMADDGGFVVAWLDDQESDKLYDISARRFGAGGDPLFPQFFVASTTGSQAEPAIAMGPGGDFVVAWRDDSDLNFFGQIRATAFTASGTERFRDRTLNEVGAGNQYEPAVAIGNDGRIVAAWVDQGQQVRARLFEPDGTPLSGDLVANEDRFRPHSLPEVTVADDGSFLVVWQELRPTGRWQLRGQAFDALGAGQGVFAIEDGRGGDQRGPTVVAR